MLRHGRFLPDTGAQRGCALRVHARRFFPPPHPVHHSHHVRLHGRYAGPVARLLPAAGDDVPAARNAPGPGASFAVGGEPLPVDGLAHAAAVRVAHPTGGGGQVGAKAASGREKVVADARAPGHRGRVVAHGKGRPPLVPQPGRHLLHARRQAQRLGARSRPRLPAGCAALTPPPPRRCAPRLRPTRGQSLCSPRARRKRTAPQ